MDGALEPVETCTVAARKARGGKFKKKKHSGLKKLIQVDMAEEKKRTDKKYLFIYIYLY